jgi:hypothetical protein
VDQHFLWQIIRFYARRVSNRAGSRLTRLNNIEISFVTKGFVI